MTLEKADIFTHEKWGSDGGDAEKVVSENHVYETFNVTFKSKNTYSQSKPRIHTSQNECPLQIKFRGQPRESSRKAMTTKEH